MVMLRRMRYLRRLIRIAQDWTGYVALIPKGVKHVVLLVSGVTGMAQMLQMIYSLPEECR
jgi:hypothetical protein